MSHKNELISAMESLPKDVQAEIKRKARKRFDKNHKNDPVWIEKRKEIVKRSLDSHKTITPFSLSKERMEEIKRKAKGK